MASFGVHHEWGKLREVVIGLAPAEDIVVFYEDSQRWLIPPNDDFCRTYSGRRLIDIDPERARRIFKRCRVPAEDQASRVLQSSLNPVPQ